MDRHHDLFTRWLTDKKPPAPEVRKTGRPRKRIDVRQLILRLARENAWGYGRIVGELRKLDIHHVCASTVRNILGEKGLEPGPQRGQTRWDQFIESFDHSHRLRRFHERQFLMSNILNHLW